MHTVRRRFVLAVAAGLLALPLQAPNLSVQSATTLSAALQQRQEARVEAEKHKQALLAAYIASTYRKPFQYAQTVVRVTFEVAKQYSLPPSLLLAIMAKESSFEHRVVSSYGATGLMQVVPRFHLERLENGETAQSLQNPTTNIRVGADILSEYVSTEGSLDKALLKYSGNATAYARRVQAYWRKLDAVENLQLEP